MYIAFVHRNPPLVSTFYACLTIISRCVPGESKTNLPVKHRSAVYHHIVQGAVSIRKTVLPGMAIPMLKIRRPNGRLIFNMEIAIRR